MKAVTYNIARADTGALLPYAVVTVFQSDGVTKATIFTAGGGALGNPVTADVNGAVTFAAANGTYVLSAVSADGAYSVPTITTQVFDLDALATSIAAVGITSVVTKKYQTEALMRADLVPGDGVIALVYGDSNAIKNDLYYKIGGTGTGSWSGSLGLMAGLASQYATAGAASATAADLARKRAQATNATSWAVLSAITGVTDGDPGFVPASDTGFHTSVSGDAVGTGTGGNTQNAGRYVFVAATPAWKRVGNLDSQDSATQSAGAQSAASDAVTRASAVLANIYDDSRGVLNFAIRMSDGLAVANTGKKRSDFIRIGPSTNFATLTALFGDGTYGIAFYTAASEGSFISASGVNGLAAGGTVTAPATANFFRFTMQTAALAAGTHVVRGSTAPTVFRAFENLDTFSAYGFDAARAAERYVLTSPNLYNPATVTLGYYITATGSLTSGAGWNTTDFIPDIMPGSSYVPNIKANTSGTGIIWFAADKTTVTGTAMNHLADTAYTAPAGTAYARIGYSSTATLGIPADKKFCFAKASTAVDISSYGFESPGGAATKAHKAVRDQVNTQNLFRRKDMTRNALYTATSGAFAYSASFGTTGAIEVRPGQQIYFNRDCQAASPSTAVRFSDRDGNAIAWGVASGGVISTDTALPNQITLTTLGNTMLLVGTPISGTGIPTGAYITSAPTGFGLGVYGITSPTGGVTATNTGVTLSAGGYLSGVPITVPPLAHYMHAPIASNTDTVLEITDTPRVAAQKRIGWDDVMNARPWMGRPVATTGDSINAGGPIGGASAGFPYGNHQSVLEQQLRCDLILPYATNGRKMRDAFLGNGNYYIPTTPDLVSSDFDSVGKTITADVTNGLKTINVTAISVGRILPGSIVIGTGIPSNTRVEGYPNGGTFGTGQITLTNAFTGTTTTGATLTFISPFSEGGLVTFAFGRNDFTSATTFSASISINNSTSITVNSTTGTIDVGSYPIAAGIPAGAYIAARGTGTGGAGTYVLNVPTTGGAATVTATGTHYGNARPLGALGDTSSSGTFFGDIHKVTMEQAHTWQPKLRLVMFGTIPSFDNNDLTSVWAGNPINVLGLRMTDYDAAMEASAKALGFDYINMRPKSGLNKITAPTRMLADLVHQTLAYNQETFTGTYAAELNALYT